MTIGYTEILLSAASGSLLLAGIMFKLWLNRITGDVGEIKLTTKRLEIASAVIESRIQEIENIREQSTLAYRSAKRAHERIDANQTL